MKGNFTALGLLSWITVQSDTSRVGERHATWSGILHNRRLQDKGQFATRKNKVKGRFGTSTAVNTKVIFMTTSPTAMERGCILMARSLSELCVMVKETGTA